MKQFRLGDIAKCCCGRLVNGDPAAEVHSVAIDDRKVQPGDLTAMNLLVGPLGLGR